MVWFMLLIGLFIGVVVNQLADQLPAREPVWSAAKCGHCAGTRPRLSHFATLAYLSGHFRCPACGAPLSLRHVATELGMAVAFALLFQSRGLTLGFVFGAFYLSVFVLVLITDLEHRLIFNVVILPALLIALSGPFVLGKPTPQSAIIGAALGFLFFYAVAMLRPGAMGAGDVKLAAFIGAITGFPLVLYALAVGIFAGGFVALILVITGVKTMKSYIPYGPFLVFGGALFTFFGASLGSWLRGM